MYPNVGNESEFDTDFSRALALLHSTQEDSTEKLRGMLIASMEKRLGKNSARIGKCHLNAKARDGSATKNAKKQKSEKRKLTEKPERQAACDVKFLLSDANETKTSNEICTGVLVDYSEKEDIPRISIPDEGFADEALCKVFLSQF